MVHSKIELLSYHNEQCIETCGGIIIYINGEILH